MVGSAIRQLIEAPLKRRQVKWFEEVRQLVLDHEATLTRLAAQDPQRLDEVLSVIAMSYSAAVRTHIEEKRAMLLKAIENTIVRDTDFDLLSYFVRLIEDFQPVHMKVLKAYEFPEPLYERKVAEIYQDKGTDVYIGRLVVVDNPKLSIYVEAAEQELESRSLIARNGTTKIKSGEIVLRGCLTELGRLFLDHIQ